MSDLPPGAGMVPPGGPGAMSTRTDKSPGQPVRVPTGLPYGQAKALENAQQAVPLPVGNQPTGTGSGPVPAPAGPAPGGSAPNPLAVLSHPTQRPNEPLTTLPPGMPNTLDTLGSMLNRLASSPGATDEVRNLANFVAQGRM